MHIDKFIMCAPVLICCVVTLMCFYGIISSPVSHLFPASEIKLNMSIVNTDEGSGIMKLFGNNLEGPTEWKQVALA